MPVSRRGLFSLLGTAGGDHEFDAAVLSARGLEDHFADLQAQAQGQAPRQRPVLPPGVEEIKISSNENPLGPGRAVIDAIRGKFAEAGRYPFNSTPSEYALAASIIDRFRVKVENVVLGAGSQEILQNSMRAWVTPTRSLITALPTYESPTHFAKRHTLPFVQLNVDAQLRLDIDGMGAAA